MLPNAASERAATGSPIGHSAQLDAVVLVTERIGVKHIEITPDTEAALGGHMSGNPEQVEEGLGFRNDEFPNLLHRDPDIPVVDDPFQEIRKGGIGVFKALKALAVDGADKTRPGRRNLIEDLRRPVNGTGCKFFQSVKIALKIGWGPG